MKQAISVLLLCVFLSLCGCQSNAGVGTGGTESEASTEIQTDHMEERNYVMADGTTIEPETLVDTDGAVVRLLGIENTVQAPLLDLSFNKGNRQYVDFIIDYVKVDGWQVSGGVLPNYEDMGLSLRSYSENFTEFMGVLSIFTSPLEECGLLDQIHEIEFGYQLIGPSSEGIIAEGVYSASTSNEGGAIEFTCDGPVLLEVDGIKIQIYSFTHGTYLDENCEDLILYYENDSERRIEIVIDEAEKYEETEEEDNGEEKQSESNVISRSEKEGKLMSPVPLYGGGDLCVGSHALGKLQTADIEEAYALSDNEVLSFVLSVYDYEEYNSESLVEPLFEKTVTLSAGDLTESD